jgi:hypothetical protein
MGKFFNQNLGRFILNNRIVAITFPCSGKSFFNLPPTGFVQFFSPKGSKFKLTDIGKGKIYPILQEIDTQLNLSKCKYKGNDEGEIPIAISN